MSTKSAFHPTDYGNLFNKQNSTIRMAIANSFNVPAVKAISFTGVDAVVDTARRMGITDIDASAAALKAGKQCTQQATAAECVRHPLALGSVEVSPLQMVGAYQVFANQGVHVPPQGILDVWDNYGHQLYHFDPARVQGNRVFTPQVSYMMTSILTDEEARDYEFHGVHELSFWDWDGRCSTLPWRVNVGVARCIHDVATKTGTTNEFRDNWTIGYTPNAVVGVWAGNANNKPMTNEPTGITGAAPIWHDVMEYVSGRPCASIDPTIKCPPKPLDIKRLGLNGPKQFTQPEGLEIACTAKLTGLKDPDIKDGCNQDWILAGQQPQQIGFQQKQEDDKKDENNGDNNKNSGDNNNNGDQGKPKSTG
jgi:membrane peptidoglycan carboxypeptidase